MADFIQKASVKRSVRIIATPIASVAALNTLVQGAIDTNAFECVDHVVAGVTIAGITRGTQSFGVNVVYENPGLSGWTTKTLHAESFVMKGRDWTISDRFAIYSVLEERESFC